MSNISVKTEKLTRRFGSFTAVDAVSIEVQQGEIFGFLGANGAGKTTMIVYVYGLFPPPAAAAPSRDSIFIAKASRSKRTSAT
ncbi:MAG: ATP-binding cassette domain-containing protein [Calditrichia bacterium]